MSAWTLTLFNSAHGGPRPEIGRQVPCTPAKMNTLLPFPHVVPGPGRAILCSKVAWSRPVAGVARMVLVATLALSFAPAPAGSAERTEVSIVDDAFHINGRPTYEGREWNGHRIEGLLMNARLVQATFDDRNPDTVGRWAYPDTGRWDPDRNTNEFIAAMPSWREHGMLAFTVNLQGGSPEGYSREQPWHNSAFESDGSLHGPTMERMRRVLDKADELGMVVILGYFYFGQDQRLTDDEAVLRAVDNATSWVLDGGWRNVLVEIANECDNQRYERDIIKAPRVHELIERVQGHESDGRRLLVSVSYNGGQLPRENVVRAADFLFLHGNGVRTPERMAELVRQTRELPGYRKMPIVNNEDDHYQFDQPMNNLVACVKEYASWGYFDFRRQGEGFDEGFQSVPVNWTISSDRKRAFFDLLKEITGGAAVE